jgi:hypothetical protein
MDTVSFRTGATFWKGFSGEFNADVLKNEKYFFLSLTEDVAKIYMRLNNNRLQFSPFMCQYKLTRPIRLVKLTKNSIKHILSKFDKNSSDYKCVKFAFAKGTKNNKMSMLKNVMNERVYTSYKGSIPNTSNRLSFYESNKKACTTLCEFFKENNIDGYYYSGVGFHEEVMICDASKKIFKIMCKKVHMKPNVLYNRNLMFARNVINSPNATFSNIEKLSSKHKIELILKLIPKSNSINNLRKFSMYSHIPAIRDAIKKKKELLELPERVKNLFNKNITSNRTFMSHLKKYLGL